MAVVGRRSTDQGKPSRSLLGDVLYPNNTYRRLARLERPQPGDPAGGDNLTFSYILGDGTSVIATGARDAIPINFQGIIVGVRLLPDIPGSVTLDLLKCQFDAYPTGLASICGATPPNMVSAGSYEDIALAGWDTSLTYNDILRIDVVAAADCTRCTVWLHIVASN